jgi:hypothetical protein
MDAMRNTTGEYYEGILHFPSRPEDERAATLHINCLREWMCGDVLLISDIRGIVRLIVCPAAKAFGEGTGLLEGSIRACKIEFGIDYMIEGMEEEKRVAGDTVWVAVSSI